ncbi:MAG: YbjN domain-containing protein [Arcanobacterium sp.]|nr:YbjN domain-containing protein [Arcanobacterium sp.]
MLKNPFRSTPNKREQLLADIDSWHKNGEHQRIIDAITEIPENDRGYELTCLLARALSNLAKPGTKQYRALLLRTEELLRSVETEGLNDPLWHFRMGCALFYLDREEEALPYFRQAVALDPDDSEALELIKKSERIIARSHDIAPVTLERIQIFFDENECSYDTEDSATIKTGFNSNTFAFRILDNSSMQMWSVWAPDIPIEMRNELLNICNEWNNTTKWPKVYLQVKDNGVLWACCEHTVLTGYGYTTNQLFQNIDMFIQTSLDFFRELAQRFPQFTAHSESESTGE